MSQNTPEPEKNKPSEPTTPGAPTPGHERVTDTRLGVVQAWTAYGLRLGKTALARSAKALQRAARRLDTLAARLDKKPA